MNNTWIVIANSSEANIYILDEALLAKGKVELTEVSNLNHPESRQRDTELVSDRPGRFTNATTGGNSSYESPTDPHKYEADIFAKQLATVLESGHQSKDFNKLIMVLPAQFHGLLKKHLHKDIIASVNVHIEKDYTKEPKLRLLKLLSSHLLPNN